MRVYYVGSHSTGKSTLARYTSEQYGLPLLPEVARAVLAEKELHLDSLRSDLNVVDDYQGTVFHRQLEEESKLDSFVSDRSAIDALCYSAQHSRLLPDLLADKGLTSYIKRLKQPDTLVFFVRPSRATLKDDGVREKISWDSIIAIDAMVKLMLEMYEVRYFSIDTSSMQERVMLVDSVISLMK